MINFLKRFLYLNISIIFLITSAYADIPIHIMPNTGYPLTTEPTNTNIKTIATEALNHAHINISNNSRYAFAQVKLIQTASERYLLVHLMSRYYFSYQIVRINLNTNNTIQYPLITHYHLRSSDFLAQSNNITDVTPECPTQYQTGKPLFVIATPSYEYYKSISNSVDALSKAVLKTHQYQLVKLLDNDATIQNYQNILACPNLKYFAHFGGSDDYGQSFALSDGDFDATYFSQNPQLNLNNKIISLDSCNLFDQVDQGFCPILSKMTNPPLAYTAGSSQLLIYGSAETYACFWKKILAGAPITQSTLSECAVAHDPSVRGSQSGIYLTGNTLTEYPDAQVLIQTNQRVIQIQPNNYTVLKLHNGEMVTQYSVTNDGYSTVCAPSSKNRVMLLNNPGLNSGEFVLSAFDKGTCVFSDISRMQRNGDLTRDIYGFDPGQSCFQLPNKPPIGLSAATNQNFSGFVDLNCNGTLLFEINSDGGRIDWETIISQLHTNSVDCTFSTNNTKTEITSLHLNIRPSTTLPGELSGQISNVNSMNGYPMPTITYSGKGDAQGYHNGVGIVINSK